MALSVVHVSAILPRPIKVITQMSSRIIFVAIFCQLAGRSLKGLQPLFHWADVLPDNQSTFYPPHTMSYTLNSIND